MSLNISPFYPKNHPTVTFPDKDMPNDTSDPGPDGTTKNRPNMALIIWEEEIRATSNKRQRAGKIQDQMVQELDVY